MLLTIALVLVAMIVLAAPELWLFWRLGERDERRRTRIRSEIDAAAAEKRRTDTRSRAERHHTSPGLRAAARTIDFARRRA